MEFETGLKVVEGAKRVHGHPQLERQVRGERRPLNPCCGFGESRLVKQARKAVVVNCGQRSEEDDLSAAPGNPLQDPRDAPYGYLSHSDERTRVALTCQGHPE